MTQGESKSEGAGAQQATLRNTNHSKDNNVQETGWDLCVHGWWDGHMHGLTARGWRRKKTKCCVCHHHQAPTFTWLQRPASRQRSRAFQRTEGACCGWNVQGTGPGGDGWRRGGPGDGCYRKHFWYGAKLGNLREKFCDTGEGVVKRAHQE